MRLTCTNSRGPTTLSETRYLVEFENEYSAALTTSCIRAVSNESDDFVMAASDMYRLAEIGFECDDEVDVEHTDEVMKLRCRAHTKSALLAVEVNRKLYPFQQTGVMFLQANRDCLLADEMGLGKTVQALMALPHHAHGLIVAPKSLVHTWACEGATWRPDLMFTVLKRAGLRATEPGELIITTPDAIRLHHEINGIPFNHDAPSTNTYLILDEAHLYKTPGIGRTKAIERLVTHYDNRWLLTGTPLANKPPDLWNVLNSIGLARRMFGGWDSFVSIFGGVKTEDGAWYWAKEPVKPKELAEAFRGRVLRRLRKVVAPQIPPKTYATVHSVYRHKIDAEERSTVKRAFASGSLDEQFKEPLAAVRRKLAESKIETMLDEVSRFEQAEEPLVVVSANLAPLEALREATGCVLITGQISAQQRAIAVRGFQEGLFKLIGIQTQAGGVGITLTAAHHMLMVQRDWSGNEQAEDRICRIGQTETCVIWDIISDHPLDRIIHSVLRSKARLHSETMSAIPTQ